MVKEHFLWEEAFPFSLSSSSLGAPRERWANLQSSQICVVYLAKLAWLTSESLQICINKPEWFLYGLKNKQNQVVLSCNSRQWTTGQIYREGVQWEETNKLLCTYPWEAQWESAGVMGVGQMLPVLLQQINYWHVLLKQSFPVRCYSGLLCSSRIPVLGFIWKYFLNVCSKPVHGIHEL